MGEIEKISKKMLKLFEVQESNEETIDTFSRLVGSASIITSLDGAPKRVHAD